MTEAKVVVQNTSDICCLKMRDIEIDDSHEDFRTPIHTVPVSPTIELPDNLRASFSVRLSNQSLIVPDSDQCVSDIQIPIVGYEVMEERSRFTVYKLKVENKNAGESWFVFRRYTDFDRLCAKLKQQHPNMRLSLPRKRWFGDNFDAEFLKERIHGLQMFINEVLKYQILHSNSHVKDFFCLEGPPTYSDGIEESKALFESLEETIYHLQVQLKDKDAEVEKIKGYLDQKTMQLEKLNDFIKNATKDCCSCQEKLDSLMAQDFFQSGSPKNASTPQK